MSASTATVISLLLREVWLQAVNTKHYDRYLYIHLIFMNASRVDVEHPATPR